MSCEDVLVISGITTVQRLTANDCLGASGRSDKFFIVAARGERLLITETSTAFVPHLQLRRNGEVAAETDGAASGSATIDFTSTALALLEIHAMGGAPQEGAYTLTIARMTPITTNAAPIRAFVHARVLFPGATP